MLRVFILLFTILLAFDADAQTKPRHVEVKGRPGRFRLLVDGKPYFIKGVGFDVGRLAEAETEIQQAKETGFNSLRFWGQNSVDLAGLDLAEKYGMTVVPAWWMSHGKKGAGGRDYEDATQNEDEIHKILQYVILLKDHPAVLMWGIGNEAGEMSGQGEAFAKHLEQVCQAVHKADPNHPIIYAGINDVLVKQFARNTRSLDIYGCNTYSGWSWMNGQQRWISNKLDRPIVFTEFGPGLPPRKLDARKDALSYTDAWKKAIVRGEGYNLGAYFFVFRDGKDEWFGIFDKTGAPKPVIHEAIKKALHENP